MRGSRSFLCLSLALLAAPWQAQALLSNNAEIGIDASGRVDTDSFGPNPPLARETETELVEPFVRSVVTVAEAQTVPGLARYDYFASADIGNLLLKVSGTLENLTNNPMNGFGVALLQATAEVRDVITLSIAGPDPVPVTVNMRVDGNFDFTGGSGSVNTGLRFDLTSDFNPTFVSRFLTHSGPVNNPNTPEDESLLTITQMLSGPTVELEIYTLLFLNLNSVNANSTVSGNLSNTAVFELILPEGVSLVSSTSGTFNEVIPEPVPLPGALALMLAPLAFGLRRRR